MHGYRIATTGTYTRLEAITPRVLRDELGEDHTAIPLTAATMLWITAEPGRHALNAAATSLARAADHDLEVRGPAILALPPRPQPARTTPSLGATSGHIIEILHNVATDPSGRSEGLRGYQAHHPVTLVFAYTGHSDTTTMLATAFELFNIGDDDTARAYRARSLRSLCVGDVIAIDGQYHAIAPTGFTKLDAPPRLARIDAHGTRPWLDSA